MDLLVTIELVINYFIRFEFERVKVGWKPEEDAPIIAMLCRHNLPAWIGTVQGIHAVVT